MSLGSHLLFYISCYIVKEFVNLKILGCSWSYFTFLKLCVFLYNMIESFMHQLLYMERWWDLHITCSIWVYLALSEESVLHLSCNSRKPQTLHTKTEIENWSIIGSLDMIPDCMEEILLSIWEPKMSFTKVLSQWCNQRHCCWIESLQLAWWIGVEGLSFPVYLLNISHYLFG